MAKGKTLDMTEKVLLVVGGLNWGLELFGWNVVTKIGEALGQLGAVEWIVYGAVGLSALHQGVMMIKEASK